MTQKMTNAGLEPHTASSEEVKEALAQVMREHEESLEALRLNELKDKEGWA